MFSLMITFEKSNSVLPGPRLTQQEGYKVVYIFLSTQPLLILLARAILRTNEMGGTGRNEPKCKLREYTETPLSCKSAVLII